jgi:CHAT domain/Lecithin:cholesterol acyltransferase
MPRLKDVIVFLPGIMGSVLERNGKDIWAPSAGGFLNAVASRLNDIKSLRLEADPIDQPDLRDGVIATKLMPSAQIIPGLWKIDGYSETSEAIEKVFENVQLNRNYFEFPYDWRRDNRVAAKRLQASTEKWLKDWQTASDGDPDAKLILVAHSMGGLVSRYFLEVLGGWRSTRALITFGTPYSGSLNALNFLANGYKKAFNLIDMSEMLRSFTSIYQLLPNYKCCDYGDGELFRVDNPRGIPNVDPQRVAAAFSFHREIAESQAKNSLLPEYATAGYRIYPVVGTHQPTLQSARIVQGASGQVQLISDYLGQDYSGDGTVPRVSATPLEWKDSSLGMFVADRHASLQYSGPVLEYLDGVLTGLYMQNAIQRNIEQIVAADDGLQRAVNEAIDRSSGLVRLGVAIDDAFAVDEPILVRVNSDRPTAMLKAIIQSSADNSFVSETQLQPASDKTFSAELAGLPNGLYRITIQGDQNVLPVADLFEVYPNSTEPQRTHSDDSAIELAEPIDYKALLTLQNDLPLKGKKIRFRRPIKNSSGAAPHPWPSEPEVAASPQPEDPKPSSHPPPPPHYTHAKPPINLRRTPESPSPMRGGDNAAPAPPPDSEAPPTAKEGTLITRYPSIDLKGELRAGGDVTLTIDLALVRDIFTETTGISLNLPEGWEEVPVRVKLVAPELAVHSAAGAILIRNGKPSIPWKLKTKIIEGLADTGRISIRASFEYDGRFIGSARRAFPLSAQSATQTSSVVAAQAPSAAAEPAPHTTSGEADLFTPAVVPRVAAQEIPIATTAGTFSLNTSIAPPTLTIQMFRQDTGQFFWHLGIPDNVIANCHLPGRLSGPLNLQIGTNLVDPPAYVAALFSTADSLTAPGHKTFFEGMGERLYQLTPTFFQQAYWELVRVYGFGFPIQIISDDPYIPWELMRPGDATHPPDYLGVRHPIARWFLDYEGSRQVKIPGGRVATIAPDYKKRPPVRPLDAAQKESKSILQMLGARATSVSADTLSFIGMFEDTSKSDYALVHYAGHGTCKTDQAEFAYLMLENGDVHVYDIRRSMVALGANRHSLVFLNACQVGQSGLNLAVIGGFAEGLMNRQFGGLVAPLWSVYDDPAKTCSTTFIQDVFNGTPFAKALQTIRAQFGDASPTYLSYLYYGDVMASYS